MSNVTQGMVDIRNGILADVPTHLKDKETGKASYGLKGGATINAYASFAFARSAERPRTIKVQFKGEHRHSASYVNERHYKLTSKGKAPSSLWVDIDDHLEYQREKEEERKEQVDVIRSAAPKAKLYVDVLRTHGNSAGGKAIECLQNGNRNISYTDWDDNVEMSAQVDPNGELYTTSLRFKRGYYITPEQLNQVLTIIGKPRPMNPAKPKPKKPTIVFGGLFRDIEIEKAKEAPV